MSRSTWTRMGLALTAAAALAVCSAQAQQPSTGERIGEKLDEASSSIKRAVGRAGDGMKEQYARAKASVHAMGVEGRVYGRIHWDKALNLSTIDVNVAADGTATLTGTVANLAAKMKATQLASDTVGVTRVVDQLATPTPTAAP